MMSIVGISLNDKIVENYISALIGQFYKILPIRESEEPSLKKYMLSLQREMIGCNNLIVALNNDELYLSLLSILQFLIDHECDIPTVKSEVFKAIHICKKLQRRYGAKEVLP